MKIAEGTDENLKANPNSEARNKLKFRNSKDFKQRHIYKKGLQGIIYLLAGLGSGIEKNMAATEL